ncbi:MAG: hypothetical protein AB7Q17_00765 [Phycisphaerae bacterium]
MPIQFRCPGCEQPIEVDDAYANQSATCPYCRRLVTVPAASTYDAAGAPVARPSTAPADGVSWGAVADADAAGDLPDPAAFARHAAATRFGKLALVCAVCAVVLFGVQLVIAVSVGMEYMSQHAGQRPTQDELMRYIQERPPSTLLAIAGLGMPLLSILGVALAAASVSQRRRQNWNGWVSLGVCGALLLCSCGSMAVAGVRGG